MQPDERDAAYLWDMLTHARIAVDITVSTTFPEYQRNRVTQLSLERALEIIGEAAGRVSREFRAVHDDIPWKRIIAHRNILAHEYDDVLQDLLWVTATEHVPSLITKLEQIVPPVPPEV